MDILLFTKITLSADLKVSLGFNLVWSACRLQVVAQTLYYFGQSCKFLPFPK